MTLRIRFVLLLQKSVLNVLVDQGEHNRMGGCLDHEGGPRREGDDDAGCEEKEENCRCKKIPHSLCSSLKSFYANFMRHGPSVRVLSGQLLISIGGGFAVEYWGNELASNLSIS